MGEDTQFTGKDKLSVLNRYLRESSNPRAFRRIVGPYLHDGSPLKRFVNKKDIEVVNRFIEREDWGFSSPDGIRLVEAIKRGQFREDGLNLVYLAFLLERNWNFLKKFDYLTFRKRSNRRKRRIRARWNSRFSLNRWLGLREVWYIRRLIDRVGWGEKRPSILDERYYHWLHDEYFVYEPETTHSLWERVGWDLLTSRVRFTALLETRDGVRLETESVPRIKLSFEQRRLLGLAGEKSGYGRLKVKAVNSKKSIWVEVDSTSGEHHSSVVVSESVLRQLEIRAGDDVILENPNLFVNLFFPTPLEQKDDWKVPSSYRFFPLRPESGFPEDIQFDRAKAQVWDIFTELPMISTGLDNLRGLFPGNSTDVDLIARGLGKLESTDYTAISLTAYQLGNLGTDIGEWVRLRFKDRSILARVLNKYVPRNFVSLSSQAAKALGVSRGHTIAIERVDDLVFEDELN